MPLLVKVFEQLDSGQTPAQIARARRDGHGTVAWNLRDTGIRARAPNKPRLRLSLLPLAILSTT
jgi:hypothetical protein